MWTVINNQEEWERYHKANTEHYTEAHVSRERRPNDYPFLVDYHIGGYESSFIHFLFVSRVDAENLWPYLGPNSCPMCGS